MPGRGDEANSHFNPEPHGPTYSVVMSDKRSWDNPQDPHWTGQLLRPAVPRTEERVADFWDAVSLLRDDSLRLSSNPSETMTMGALNDKDAQAN